MKWCPFRRDEWRANGKERHNQAMHADAGLVRSGSASLSLPLRLIAGVPCAGDGRAVIPQRRFLYNTVMGSAMR